MNQELLPTFEPSEADLYDQAVAMPLADKIALAIETLKLYEPIALRLNPAGYYLAYSGGKDSNVIIELAKMAGVQYQAYYNVTTMDPPELVRYIKSDHPEVIFNRREMALLTMMVEHPGCKGPPTRLARWCCEEYKEQGGSGTMRILGVRSEESARRKALWQVMLNHRKGGKILCPILYWTDTDVWVFHRQRNLTHCSLYDEGYTRLGCVGCPLAGPKKMLRDFDRWPKYEYLWRRAFQRFWDRWHGVPTRKGTRRWFEDFESPERLWDWWTHQGDMKPGNEECQGSSLFD